MQTHVTYVCCHLSACFLVSQGKNQRFDHANGGADGGADVIFMRMIKLFVCVCCVVNCEQSRQRVKTSESISSFINVQRANAEDTDRIQWNRFYQLKWFCN